MNRRKAIKTEKKLLKALKKEAKTLANQPDTAYDKEIISWTAPEYIRYRKSWVWYLLFTAVIWVSSILAYFYISWSFAMALLAFELAYLITELKHPKIVKTIISEMGIKVGNKIYQYGRIRAFWINYNPPYTKSLNIRVYNEFLVDIEIQLGNQNPVEIYNFLSTRLPELQGKSEGFIKTLERLFKL